MPQVIPTASDIVKSTVTTLIVTVIVTVGGALLGVLDSSVPLWVVVVLAAAAVLAFIAGRIAEAGENLEPLYVDHVREILDTLQKVIAGEIPGVTIGDFVERGVLAPARQWLANSADEDVRLSILVPDPADPSRFTMAFEAGHSVEARQSFALPIQGSFAGFAFTSGEMHWTNDVDTDPRWTRHPEARPGREYGSLASVPVQVGAQSVGVLNVISTSKDAFLPSELMYVDLLGSIINVVWSLGLAETGQERPGSGDLLPG